MQITCPMLDDVNRPWNRIASNAFNNQQLSAINARRARALAEYQAPLSVVVATTHHHDGCGDSGGRHGAKVPPEHDGKRATQLAR